MGLAESVIVGVVAVIAAFVVGVVKGGSREKLEREREERNRYVATSKRIDDAVRRADSAGADPDWLHDRSKR